MPLTRSLRPLALVAALATLGLLLVPPVEAGTIVRASDRSFDEIVLDSDRAVLVAFGAPWCAPCKRLEQHLDVVAEARESDLLVAKVNLSRAEDLAQRYGVATIPTLLLFRDGVEVARERGIQSRETLELFLERNGPEAHGASFASTSRSAGGSVALVEARSGGTADRSGRGGR